MDFRYTLGFSHTPFASVAHKKDRYAQNDEAHFA